MNLERAEQIALEVIAKLQPHVSKIDIAGSIRRRKPEVKDIEIVVRPLTTVMTDLFGGETESISEGFCDAVRNLGLIIKGNPNGRYMQIGLQTITLDLFIPTESDYYRQFAIRTGSADFSHKVIATAWKNKGWCGTEKGLRKIEDCEKRNGKWEIVNKDGEKPPVWKSEEEFFEWLGLNFLEPEERSM